MYSQVKLLREGVGRKHDQQISKEDPLEGDGTVAHCSGSYQLTLAGHDGSRQEPIVPVLYDARLITMHGNKMLFKGIERNQQTGADVVQEWSVVVQ